jgi:hypothetical protein
MSNCQWLMRCAFVGLAACGACTVTAAAEWSMQPTVQWYFDHDSNRLLAPVGAEANDAAWLTIDTVLKRATETGEIDAHPELQIQRFSGGSALDSTNGSLQLSAMNKGEIYSYTASAGYSDNSTLISELANSGIINASTRQEAATGSAGVTDQFTERQRVGIQGTYTDVKYPGGERVGLIGYRDPGISTTYTYGLSPQTSLSAIAYGSQVTAPQVGFDSRDVGGRLSWARILSPTTNISAAVGIIRTHIASEEVGGSTWAVQATHHSELSQWTFSFTRDVVPSGLGLLIRRDELDLSVIRSIAPRLDATLSMLAAHNSDLVTSFIGDNRRYFTGAAGFNWHTAPQWVLSFTVRASEARAPSDVERLQLATGWQTVLSLLWTPLPWSKSL